MWSSCYLLKTASIRVSFHSYYIKENWSHWYCIIRSPRFGENPRTSYHRGSKLSCENLACLFASFLFVYLFFGIICIYMLISVSEPAHSSTQHFGKPKQILTNDCKFESLIIEGIFTLLENSIIKIGDRKVIFYPLGELMYTSDSLQKLSGQ